MASRFARQLETHDVFKLSSDDVKQATQRVWGDARDPVDSNVVACSSDLNLFVCDRTNHVRVINMKTFREGRPADTKALVFDPPIKYRIVKIMLNASGTLLAAVGVNQCTIVELSERVRSHLLSTSDDDVICHTYPMAEFLLSGSGTLKIEKAEWHPLSNSHLVLLTSDNIIRFYNVSVDTEEPEQVLRIPDLLQHNVKMMRSFLEDQESSRRTPSKSTPQSKKNKVKQKLAGYYSSDLINGDASVVTFSFGSAKSGSWLPFTIFVLLSTGEVFYISPVIPYECPLKFQLLKDLEEETQDAIHNLEMSPTAVEKWDYEAVDLRKQWIYEVTGDVVAMNAADPNDFEIVADQDDANSDLEAEISRYRHRSVFSAQKRSREWIRTRRPKSMPPLRAQGPICFVRDGDIAGVKEETQLVTAMGHATDLACTASSPPVLVRAFGRGAVEASLICDALTPAWKYPKIPSAIASSVEGIFWEGCDLQYHQPTEAPAAHTPFSPVKIVTYPHHEYLIYAVSSRGVHRIDLVWLPRLQHALSKEGAFDKTVISKLKNSDVDFLLNTQPVRSSLPTAVVGTAFLSQPSSGAVMEFFLVVTEHAEVENAQGGDPRASLTSVNLGSPSRFQIEAGMKQDPEKVKDHLKKLPHYNPEHFSWRVHCLDARRPNAAKHAWLSSFDADDEVGTIRDSSGLRPRDEDDAVTFPVYKPPPAPGAIPRIGQSPSLDSPESLRYFLQWAKRIRENQGVYALKVHHAVSTRLDLIAERVQLQNESMASLEKKFDAIADKKNAITDRVEQARQMQEVLSKRLVLLMGIINSSQKRFSKAEEQFFEEIKKTYGRLADFQARAEDLKLKCARLVPDSVADTKPFQLTEDQIQQVQGYLKAQQESLTNLTDAVAQIYREAEDLSA